MNAPILRTIGKITGLHGLRGEVTVKPNDIEATWPNQLKSVYVFKPTGSFEMDIQSARWQKTKIILSFKDINTREEAEKLVGAELKVLESNLPKLENDEFYVDELIGLTAKSNDSGETLGVIKDILSSDAGDFLEIKTEQLSEPVLIPFQDAFVHQINKADKTILIAGLDSLFKAP